MKVQRISVGVVQTGRDVGKTGFAKSGPQIERSPHWRREGPDLIRGHAYARPRPLARCNQRIYNKRFICVENRVPRHSERTSQSARGGEARSRAQLLFENRLPQLIVDLAIQRASRLRLDPQGQHGRARWALQSGTFAAKVALYQLPLLDGQLQDLAKLGCALI
jgi:hypothetical protein